jgi:hypothetical protein
MNVEDFEFPDSQEEEDANIEEEDANIEEEDANIEELNPQP